jgi:peroxiredoxin
MVFDRSSITVGRTIQDFGLGDIAGVYRNTAKLRAKGWLVVAFFDASNDAAAGATKTLIGWSESLPSDKVTILGVGIGERDDVEKFAKTNNITFPVVWDYEDYVSVTWSVNALPTIYITNVGGTVLARVTGNDIADLENARLTIEAEIAKAAEAARIAAEKAAADAATAASSAPAKA